MLAKLLGHMRRTLSAGLITQSLSDALGTSVKAVEHLIMRSVNASSAPGEPAVADFLVPAFAESHQDVAITPAEFPAQFETFRRLDKVAQIARKLALTPRQLEWLIDYGPSVPLRQAPGSPARRCRPDGSTSTCCPTLPSADGTDRCSRH